MADGDVRVAHDDEEAGQPSARSNRLGLVLLPVLAFVGLASVLFFALQTGDPSRLPSALIGKRVPAFELPAVDGLQDRGKPIPGLSSGDLAKGRLSIVNVWASWCVPCHQEHPFLMGLVELSGTALTGINYKDAPEGARRFLGRYGNPFDRVGADRAGRTAIDFGVYGVPETFIIDGKGRIVHKHVGPIDDSVIKTTLLPIIENLRKSEGGKTPLH